MTALYMVGLYFVGAWITLVLMLRMHMEPGDKTAKDAWRRVSRNFAEPLVILGTGFWPPVLMGIALWKATEWILEAPRGRED